MVVDWCLGIEVLMVGLVQTYLGRMGEFCLWVPYLGTLRFLMIR